MLRHLPAPATALLALLALTAPGCVSAARHQEAMERLEALRRENLELKRDLAEHRVRLEELAEARPGEAAPSGTPGDPVPGPPARSSRSSVPPRPDRSGAASPGTHQRGDLPDLEEEPIREARPGAPASAEGQERLLWVARRYHRQGRLAESIDAYSRFIKEYPFSPLLAEAFAGRARARLKGGDRRGALEDFRTVIEAFPSSPLAGEARREASRLGGS